MPTYRLHLPFLFLTLVLVTMAAVITGSSAGPLLDVSTRKSKMLITAPRTPHRPDFGELLTDSILILAELPCRSPGGVAEESILAVQEPYLEPDREWSRANYREPCGSILWFLRHKTSSPVEKATVLGYINRSNCYARTTHVLADVAFDSKHDQYWGVLIEGGHRLILSIYSISQGPIVGPSREALIKTADSDWPPDSNPIAFKKASSSDGFGLGSNCSLVTSLAARVESDAAGSYLVVQAHSTGDWENKRPQVKLWTWRYAIDQGTLLSEGVVDVPRPTQAPTEREQLNQKRREQWDAIIKVEADRRKTMFLRDAVRRPISQGGERTNDSGEGSSRK